MKRKRSGAATTRNLETMDARGKYAAQRFPPAPGMPKRKKDRRRTGTHKNGGS